MRQQKLAMKTWAVRSGDRIGQHGIKVGDMTEGSKRESARNMGGAKGTRPRSVETRRRILEAALDLFIEQGYDKVSLREIAERVGVAKAALYYYFPSKEQILQTLVEPLDDMRNVVMELVEHRPSREEWAARMVEFIAYMLPQRRLFELFQSNQPALRELFEARHNKQEHELMHERVNQLLADDSMSLDDKVRMTGAAVMIMGVVAAPLGPQLADAAPEDLRKALVDAVNDLLLPRPPGR